MDTQINSDDVVIKDIKDFLDTHDEFSEIVGEAMMAISIKGYNGKIKWDELREILGENVIELFYAEKAMHY